MTDQQIALQVISQGVQEFTRNSSYALNMLYGKVGHAKNPKDVAAFADGRATLVTKFGSDTELKAFESLLAHFSDWAANNLK
jgi:hypothetical protein